MRVIFINKSRGGKSCDTVPFDNVHCCQKVSPLPLPDKVTKNILLGLKGGDQVSVTLVIYVVELLV